MPRLLTGVNAAKMFGDAAWPTLFPPHQRHSLFANVAVPKNENRRKAFQLLRLLHRAPICPRPGNRAEEQRQSYPHSHPHWMRLSCNMAT